MLFFQLFEAKGREARRLEGNSSLYPSIEYFILTLMSPRLDSQFPAQLAVKLEAKNRKNEIHNCSKLPESRQYRYPIRPGNYSSRSGKFNCVYYEGGLYYCCLHSCDVKEMETLLSTHSPLYYSNDNNLKSHHQILLLFPSQVVSAS